ncbi:MAG: metal-dependent transcriptional regulator [Candidatus Cloacimonetes bacterium]|nr:metal-dependent transcriptional regulator [Candidatus Cloacimonadota bacterium]
MNSENGKAGEDLTPSQEMYLKTIYLLCQENKVARVKDIAARLDVSMSSVNGGIKGLVARELCEHNRYGYVDLSEEGRALAMEVVNRHKVLTRFLRDVLGVDENVALNDACEMEHVVSSATLKRVIAFTNFVTQEGSPGVQLMESYQRKQATTV